MVRAATLSFNVPELITDLNHCESDDFSLDLTTRKKKHERIHHHVKPGLQCSCKSYKHFDLTLGHGEFDIFGSKLFQVKTSDSIKVPLPIQTLRGTYQVGFQSENEP